VKEDMRSIIEEQEASNEELQSANEEIVSSNEELQSINEELETSKEEVESTNEELMTINTELQMRNEQLAEVYEYAEAVFGTIREAVLVLDQSLRIKSANRSFYRIFHTSEEETEGVLIYELGNRQWDIPKLRSLLEDIIPTNSHFNGFEVDHTFPSIGRKIMVLNAKRIVQKIHRQQLILLAIEDITEYREAQLELAEREARAQMLADKVPVMVWSAGLDGSFDFVNSTWREFTGRSLEQEKGSTWSSIVHPQDAEGVMESYKRAFAAKKPFNKKFRMRKHNGKYHQVQCDGKPIISGEGNFAGYIGSCLDGGDGQV